MSGTYLGLFGLDAIYLAVGYGLLYGLGLVRPRARDLGLVGLAFLAGWALMGVLLSLALMVGIPLSVATVVVCAALVITGCVVAARLRAAPVSPVAPRAWNAPAFAAAAIAAAVIVIVAAAAIITAFTSLWNPDFDLLTAWLPRARIVYSLHGLAPSQWSTFLDPWYPPLVPVQFGTTFVFVGGFHPSLLPIQQAILGVAFVVAALGLLDRVAPRWISFPSFALLITTPWFWWRMQSLLPDATLSYLLAAAAVVTLIWLWEPHRVWLVLGVVFLAAATLTKLEGSVFAGLLALVAIAAAFALRRRRGLPALLFLIGPAMTIPWRLYLDTHGVSATNPDLNQPSLLNPSFLVNRSGDFAHAMYLILRSPWRSYYRTTEAILVVGLVVVLLVARRIPVLAIAAIGWLGLVVLALATTYATSALDTTAYFAVSGSRVGGNVVVSAAALTPLLLGLALKTPARVRRRPRAPERRDVPLAAVQGE
jgi:hypothetical protein